MEFYSISAEGIKKNSQFEPHPDNGFMLVLLPYEKWSDLESHLNSLETVVLTNILSELKYRQDFRPYFERLSPSLTYICYVDFAVDGKEIPIRFFLSPRHLFLLGKELLDLRDVMDWAQRGLLKEPSDLAQLLGMEVLEHQQLRLESIEDLMDSIEANILSKPQKSQISDIISLHKQIIDLKKSLNAHQNIFSRLISSEQFEHNMSSWRDLVTVAQRELENVRQTHELVISLREAYQQAIDNRANDIMKVLTLSATVLLPINMISSFFGMNFEYLPLVHSVHGMTVFYLLSAVMLSVVLIMLWRKNLFK